MEVIPETVKSAPNLAACPGESVGCSGDCEDPNCLNPRGLYIPDERNAVDVIVGYEYKYECDRCWTHGETRYEYGREVVYACGMVHEARRFRNGEAWWPGKREEEERKKCGVSRKGFGGRGVKLMLRNANCLVW